MEDTPFVYGNDPSDGDARMTSALLDAIKIVGVDPIIAARMAYAPAKQRRPTNMDLYARGAVVHGANVSYRNLEVHGLGALDLRTLAPSGQPWDFTTETDRRLALWPVRTRKPTCVVGSPPCTAFSNLMNLNMKNVSQTQIDDVLRESRLHLHFIVQIYRANQEQPARFAPPPGCNIQDRPPAPPIMQKLPEHPSVHSVVWHLYEYGLTTADADGRPMAAKKSTRLATPSVRMTRRLVLRCICTNSHQQLVAGRAASATSCPPGLPPEMLRSTKATADMAPDQGAQDPAPPRLEKALLRTSLFHARPAPLAAVLRNQG